MGLPHIVGQWQPQLWKGNAGHSQFQIIAFNPSTELRPSNRVTRRLSPSLALLLRLCHWGLQPDILTQTTARGSVLQPFLGGTASAFEHALPAWLPLAGIYQTGGNNHRGSLVLPQELPYGSLPRPAAPA